MKYEELIALASEMHCFSPGILSAGENISQLRVQLSRWVQQEKVIRIHKGWYTLPPAYRKIRLNMAVIACTIRKGSYVSMQSALSRHGLIPEYVPETTCVTTGRSLLLETPIGRIRYRHLKKEAFWGFDEVPDGLQTGYMALQEKALLDLIYFTPGSLDTAYLRELRLQNTEILRPDVLKGMALRFGKHGLNRLPGLLKDVLIESREGLGKSCSGRQSFP